MTRWKLPAHLETERLVIRPYLSEDRQAFVDLLTEGEAPRRLGIPPERRSVEEASSLFDGILASYETDQPIFLLAVTDRESSQFVGSCGLAPQDVPGTAECFYAILSEYRESGLATEAVRELFSYAFTELQLSRIVAFVFEENPASQHVVEKLGMRCEGREKREIFPEEGLVYVATASEFLEREAQVDHEGAS